MGRSALKKKANNCMFQSCHGCNNLNDLLAIKLYKKQRNYLVNLSQKAKKEYFQKDMPHSSPSKTFLKLL